MIGVSTLKKKANKIQEAYIKVLTRVKGWTRFDKSNKEDARKELNISVVRGEGSGKVVLGA
jgi:hypothetical protein